MLTIGPPPGAAHSLGTNRRYGPFDARTTEVEDAQLDARMHMKFPGFEGNLFDADEVEKYFRVRGIVVQPGQDYVTAEVDVTHFRHHHQEEEEKQQQQDGAAAEGKEEENNDYDAKKEGKRVINLDVLLLLSELARRGTCMGRTAGYRLEDAVQAFWKAIQNDDGDDGSMGLQM